MYREHIAPKDISVIIRGLVVGADETDPDKRFTERCIKSVQRYLPGAEIILSTWQGQLTDGLGYDVVVLSEQPEPIYMTHPNGEVRQITTNNQIVTSREGIVKATRPYIINMRSDIELQGTGFIRLFQDFNAGEHVGCFIKKIVVLPTYNPRRGLTFLFDVCDWFYFGLAEDVRDLFNIPLMNTADLKGERMNGHHPVVENLGCEAYIWTHFLEKHGVTTIPNQAYWSDEALQASERSYAENTIMAPASLLNVTCLKMPNAGYGARPWLSQGLYTFDEYRTLYNRYNTPRISFIPNILEKIAYRIALGIRRIVAKLSPNLYKRLVNIVRRSHKSNNILT